MVEMGTALRAEMATFASAYTNVILLPGPSFAVVCEAGLSTSRREAGIVAIGVAFGAGALVIAIMQAAPVLQTSPSLMVAGRIACALILLIMGYRMLRRSLSGVHKARRRVSAAAARARFMTGFVAAATNPVSFASFTAAALAIGHSGHMVECVAVAVTIFLMAAGWFNTLAVVFSHPLLTAQYGRVATILGSVMGCVLMAKAIAFLALTL